MRLGERRRLGDRKDGKMIRDLDSMHYVVPILYPNRCDNEAFIEEIIDLTAMDAFLEDKNAANPAYKYNLFQCVVTAALKTLTLRPKMNRFIANRTFYQRNEVSASFVVKKEFADNGGEALAIVHSTKEDTLDSIHDKIYSQVSSLRGTETVDSSTKAMDVFTKVLPRFVSRPIIEFVCMLDRHGKVPQSFISSDPYYTSIVLSNLGSLKLKAAYHHLTNWGTNSFFIAVGEAKKTPMYDEDGAMTIKHTVKLGLTIDERLADGYYYSKTVRLLKTLLENPKLLELPLGEKVDY